MKRRKGQELGFTLIELLIVVAILGVLAAVVIPNVGRFIGRGQTESAATEKSNIQTAIISMMTDNNLAVLPHPVIVATNDLAAFPDATSACGTVGEKVKDPLARLYGAGQDKNGFILYGHDITANNSTATVVNYVAARYSKGTYTVDAYGTVTQATTGYE